MICLLPHLDREDIQCTELEDLRIERHCSLHVEFNGRSQLKPECACLLASWMTKGVQVVLACTTDAEIRALQLSREFNDSRIRIREFHFWTLLHFQC